jgi:4-amino-4-deoxy-L-arabinose transferase-like glycosyltransferase
VKLPLLFGVWAAAAILMYWMMSHGAGISPDSIVYLDTARSILAGQSFVVAGLPMTHFPPVYPLLLAAIGLVDPDLLHAARLLSAFLFGANVVLVGSAAHLASGSRIRPAICAVLLFVVSASALELHAMAWSEPPFFAFTLSGLLVLAAQVACPNRRMLALAATCLGLAMATRYVGITVFPVLLAALWFMGQRPFRERVRDTFVAVPLALAPIGLWLIRNAAVSHGVTDRHFGWHPIGGAELTQLVGTLSDYLLPVPVGVLLTVTILVGLLIIFMVLWRQSLGERPTDWHTGLSRSLPSLLVLFAATYVTFLLVSVSVADANTPLDDRMLFPVFGCLVVAMVVVGGRFAEVHPRHWASGALVALVVLSLGLRAVPAEVTVVRVYRDGNGYSSDGWRGSPAIAQLEVLSRSTLVFSNASEAVGYLTMLRVLPLPDSLSPETLVPNRRFQAQTSTLCARVNAGRAVAVYLTTEGIGDPAEQAALERRCAFRHASHFPDGTIYSAGPLATGVLSGGSD